MRCARPRSLDGYVESWADREHDQRVGPCCTNGPRRFCSRERRTVRKIIRQKMAPVPLCVTQNLAVRLDQTNRSRRAPARTIMVPTFATNPGAPLMERRRSQKSTSPVEFVNPTCTHRGKHKPLPLRGSRGKPSKAGASYCCLSCCRWKRNCVYLLIARCGMVCTAGCTDCCSWCSTCDGVSVRSGLRTSIQIPHMLDLHLQPIFVSPALCTIVTCKLH